ncbi:hypothetical protein [Kribbella sp. CA-294648]|uniref:hypothetical protein n=1 Tax=Kribbella sp. CA-294648 TaxID=3239948 RepID=UPI003D90E6A9
MGEEQPSPRRRAVKLDPLARWLTGLVGAVLLSAGGTATFTRDVEAGPVALIVSGSLFVLIGIAGVMPTRLKVGESEAEWVEIVGEAIEAVIEAVPPDARVRVDDAMQELYVFAPEVAQVVHQARAGEYVLLSRLASSVQRLGLEIVVGPKVQVNGARPDAIVTDNFGRKLWVIAVGRRLRSWQVGVTRQLLTQIKAQDEMFVGVLIVAPALQGNERRTDRTPDGTIWVALARKGFEGDFDDALGEAFDVHR